MSVLLPVAILSVAFAVAFFFRRAFSPAARAARVTEPSCGSCGYCVRGLEGMICPECGSDLREVGILTPGEQKPMSMKMRLIFWTAFAPLPALLLAQGLSIR